MVKQKIETEETTVKAHSWKCSQCDKIIVGSTPQQVAFNAGLHLDSHKGKKDGCMGRIS